MMTQKLSGNNRRKGGRIKVTQIIPKLVENIESGFNVHIYVAEGKIERFDQIVLTNKAKDVTIEMSEYKEEKYIGSISLKFDNLVDASFCLAGILIGQFTEEHELGVIEFGEGGTK